MSISTQLQVFLVSFVTVSLKAVILGVFSQVFTPWGVWVYGITMLLISMFILTSFLLAYKKNEDSKTFLILYAFLFSLTQLFTFKFDSIKPIREDKVEGQFEAQFFEIDNEPIPNNNQENPNQLVRIKNRRKEKYFYIFLKKFCKFMR